MLYTFHENPDPNNKLPNTIFVSRAGEDATPEEINELLLVLNSGDAATIAAFIRGRS